LSRRQHRRDEARSTRPARACPNCGASFVGAQNKKFCCNECTVAFNYKRPAPASTQARGDLVAYLLSDSIFSGAINGELDRLRKDKTRAIRELEACLRAELASPVWPKEILGRTALALFLLDHPSILAGRFLHPHEKRGSPKTSGFRIRHGIGP
jgi:hypothetical protein